MAGVLSAIQVLLPKGKQKAGGTSFDPTFNPNIARLTLPAYRDHLTDLYSSRGSEDSRTLMNELAKFDPDVSSAIHSYLTISGSAQMVVEAYDDAGQPAPDGITMGYQIINAITETSDYTIGSSTKPRLTELNDKLRYLTLLRGGTAGELVFDKRYIPVELRIVDPATLIWDELAPGRLVPTQRPVGVGTLIPLDIPTFFTTSFHQNPTSQFQYSTFVSAINTITARAHVINELYRVMQVTGFPRLDVEVVEEIILNSAPPALRNDPAGIRAFVAARLTELQGSFDNMRSDQAFIHVDGVKTKILNEKNPAVGLSMEGVIGVLDAQNQAALKVMPAVVGKGSNGAVASTEARLFALSCDALNRSISNLLSPALTLAGRLAGFQGRILVRFLPVELRPDLELEPQRVMRASRLKDDLSLGIISDVEYSMQVYGRPPLAGAPVLSGTNFLQAMQDYATVSVDASSVSPNADPLGKSLVPGGSKSVKSNGVTSGGGAKPKGGKLAASQTMELALAMHRANVAG